MVLSSSATDIRESLIDFLGKIFSKNKKTNYFESPFLLRVQHGCRAGDTACTLCSVWTKLADFNALYALYAHYARCGHPYILTSNQIVGSSNLPGGIFSLKIFFVLPRIIWVSSECK